MVFDKVKEVIVKQLQCNEEEVKNDALLIDDLKADSLDIVEMIFDLEEAFDISIVDGDEDNIEQLKTVEDIVNYIKAQTGLE